MWAARQPGRVADKAAMPKKQGVKALLEHLAGHNVAVVLLEAKPGKALCTRARA
jgi:hypothetical protein